MKKYLPLLLLLMAGIFMEMKPVDFLEPGEIESRKTIRWLQPGISQGASAMIAILYLPE